MWLAIIDLLSSSQAWVALLMLTLMEIVLGIDNIIFISIVANKLPQAERTKARNIGLLLAMLLRVVLLFGITWIMEMQNALFDIDWEFITGEVTGQSLVLFGGGLFLLYKSVSEIHHKLEGHKAEGENLKESKKVLSTVILQITLINVVFSLDSILTAVGLTKDLARTSLDPLPVMIVGVVLSVFIMMLFVGSISRFVSKHPSIQVLGLSFLILIAFMLIIEGTHMANLTIFDYKIHAVPKAYLYFAITFALCVEFMNIRISKKSRPVQLHGVLEEAKQEDLS